MASSIEQAVMSGLAAGAATSQHEARTWQDGRSAAAGTDATVIQFLRSKLVERDRTIFELRTQLTQADEALHSLKRQRQGANNSSDLHSHHEDHHTLQLLREEQWKRHLWKATSQVIVKSLLERLTLTVEWASGLLGIALSAHNRAGATTTTATATAGAVPSVSSSTSAELSPTAYGSLLSSLHSMDAQKAVLQAELVKHERLLASITTECKRYQNDAAGERLRADILTKRIADLNAVRASSKSTAQQVEALEITVQMANREICRLREEQRELQARNRESEQRYRELLASRERILGELESLRMDARRHRQPQSPHAAHRSISALDAMLASPLSSSAAAATSPRAMMATGPIRLARVADNSSNRRGGEKLFADAYDDRLRNPYRAGMPSLS